MRRMILLVLTFGIATAALADWSPEIELWRSDPRGGPGVYTDIATDSNENVHILYQIGFYYETTGFPWREGTVYRQFDDHGHEVVAPILLSDSLNRSSRILRLAPFGTDSVLAMWIWGDFDNPWTGYRSQTIRSDGRLLGAPEDWTGVREGGDYGHLLSVGSDRRVVLAYPDADEIHVIVQLADGSRILDDTPVWKRPDSFADEVAGFVDRTDSLQLSWRVRTTANHTDYAKRISVTAAFDSTRIADYVPVTRDTAGETYELHPVDWTGSPRSVILRGGPKGDQDATTGTQVFGRV